MRISDWSSDVCSSDLFDPLLAFVAGEDIAMHRALAIAEQIFEPRVIVLDLVPASLDALRRGQKDDGTGGGLYLYGQRRKADFRRRAQGAGRNGAGGRHDRRSLGSASWRDSVSQAVWFSGVALS